MILTFLILLSRHFLNAPRATAFPPTGTHLKDCPWIRVTLVRVALRRLVLRERLRAMSVTPYIHGARLRVRLRVVLRPTRRCALRRLFLRRTVVLPANFLRHILAARPNALRAAFGVLNLITRSFEMIHFLYPLLPAAPTLRDLRCLTLRTIVLLLRLGGEQTMRPFIKRHTIVLHPKLCYVGKVYKGVSKKV